MKKTSKRIIKTFPLLILLSLSGLAILKIDLHTYIYVGLSWLIITVITDRIFRDTGRLTDNEDPKNTLLTLMVTPVNWLIG